MYIYIYICVCVCVVPHQPTAPRTPRPPALAEPGSPLHLGFRRPAPREAQPRGGGSLDTHTHIYIHCDWSIIYALLLGGGGSLHTHTPTHTHIYTYCDWSIICAFLLGGGGSLHTHTRIYTQCDWSTICALLLGQYCLHYYGSIIYELVWVNTISIVMGR